MGQIRVRVWVIGLVIFYHYKLLERRFSLILVRY